MNDEPQGVAPPETAVPITPTPGDRPGGGDVQIIDATRPPREPQASLAPESVPQSARIDAASPGPDAVAALRLALGAYERLDWQALGARDPATATAMWAAYLGLRASEAGLSTGVPPPGQATAPAGTQQGVDADGALLAREAPGLSPLLRAQLASFGESQGFSPQEMAGVSDARAVKVLQLAMVGQAALIHAQREGQARRFDHVRPPIQVSGQAPAPPGLSDRQGADAWMETRRQQLKKKARG